MTYLEKRYKGLGCKLEKSMTGLMTGRTATRKEDDCMKKFTPYAKLSKRKKKALDEKRRGSWRGLNPITRVPPNPKAYNRKKTRKRNQDDNFNSASFFNFKF